MKLKDVIYKKNTSIGYERFSITFYMKNIFVVHRKKEV